VGESTWKTDFKLRLDENRMENLSLFLLRSTTGEISKSRFTLTISSKFHLIKTWRSPSQPGWLSQIFYSSIFSARPQLIWIFQYARQHLYTNIVVCDYIIISLEKTIRNWAQLFHFNSVLLIDQSELPLRWGPSSVRGHQNGLFAHSHEHAKGGRALALDQSGYVKGY